MATDTGTARLGESLQASAKVSYHRRDLRTLALMAAAYKLMSPLITSNRSS